MPHYTSYVRGKYVSYDKETIEEVLTLVSIPTNECAYKARTTRDSRDNFSTQREIQNALCRPGTDSWKNDDTTPTKLFLRSLTPSARGWDTSVLHTLKSCSNISELNTQRENLVTAMILGKLVDVASILQIELHSSANRKDIKPWWQHASLIALFCEKAGVIPEDDEEKLKKGIAISGAWIRTNSIPNLRESTLA